MNNISKIEICQANGHKIFFFAYNCLDKTKVVEIVNKKLLIAVLGNRNSGKSVTWQTLFNDPNIRTAQKSLRDLQLTDKEYTKIFLINGSPQERGLKVEDIIKIQPLPEIVLCSLQYNLDALESLNFFRRNEYSVYLQWLNPGHRDNGCYNDYHKIIPVFLEAGAWVSQRNAKDNDPKPRVEEIRNFICDWSRRNNLILNYNQI